MTDLTDWDEDILSEADTDDDVIELMDVVDKEAEEDSEDSVIELMDVVEEENKDLSVHSLDEGSSDNFDEEVVELTDVVENESLDLDGVDPVVKLPSESNLRVDPEQFEAALERVIEKKFADKIETILSAVMEKVIEKEIADIKKSLQNDLDDSGNN